MARKSVTDRAMQTPLVKDTIETGVGNLTQRHFRTDGCCRVVTNFLEGYARKTAEMAMVKPVVMPDFSDPDWKGMFANETFDALQFMSLEDFIFLTTKRIKKTFPKVVACKSDDRTIRFICLKLALTSGQVARMILLGLNPLILRLTPEEAFERQMTLVKKALAGNKKVFLFSA